MIILGIIVHLPFLSIPFGFYYEKTKWPSAHYGGHICIFHQPPWVSNSWMTVCLSISTIFLLLFMMQAWKAFQTFPQGKNKLSDSLLCTTPPLKITPHLVRNSTIRNALVTLCSVCGLVIYYGVFDNEIISIENEGYTRYLYECRIMLILDQMINNVCMYFIYRIWWVFLLFPCTRKRKPVLELALFDDRLSVSGESN